jgi:hypothetical protein
MPEIIMTNKLCPQCDTLKPVEEYNKAKGRGNGLQPYCRDCQKLNARLKYHEDVKLSRANAIAKRKKYAEKLNASERRRYWSNPEKESARKRLAKYGITPERFEQMKRDQDNKCAMCFCSEPGGMGDWHVDHNHRCCPGTKSCGKCIRGLLCFRCNVEVAIIEDPVWLRGALKYAAETRGIESTLYRNLSETLKISESLFQDNQETH